ncbi:hypothetical protein [Ornithinimicrobium cerasi]|uniref:hypothetical protein n=1 Tax=Ornithinimicrobium cerasi TaxID=2248773 RepID=UPI0011443D21|nr:hypothetical protein [Ornithinimicrobium cerasi]
MAPGEIFPIVNCSDLGRTRGWYERVLAGVVEYQFPADGDPEYLTCALRSRRRERGTEFRGRGPSGFSLEEEADDAGDEEPGVDVADSRGPCGGCR